MVRPTGRGESEPPDPRPATLDPAGSATGAVAARQGAGDGDGDSAGPARLTLLTRPPATVLFDGQVLGATPLKDALVPPGAQTLQLIGTDGRVVLFQVELRPGAQARYDLELASLPAVDP